MDFLERIFHISPDHGTGLTEVSILVVLFAVPLLFAARRNRSKGSFYSVIRIPRAGPPRE